MIDLVELRKDIKEGHCFTYAYSFENKSYDEIVDRILYISTYRGGEHNIDVLKGNKKLTEMIGKVDLKFPLVKEHKNNNTWYRCREHFKLTIE